MEIFLPATHVYNLSNLSNTRVQLFMGDMATFATCHDSKHVHIPSYLSKSIKYRRSQLDTNQRLFFPELLRNMIRYVNSATLRYAL